MFIIKYYFKQLQIFKKIFKYFLILILLQYFRDCTFRTFNTLLYIIYSIFSASLLPPSPLQEYNNIVSTVYIFRLITKQIKSQTYTLNITFNYVTLIHLGRNCLKAFNCHSGEESFVWCRDGDEYLIFVFFLVNYTHSCHA